MVQSPGCPTFSHLVEGLPNYTVEWYINNVYKATSYGSSDNPKTEAYFSPYDKIPGAIKGQKYIIKAVARPMAGDPTGAVTATDSYVVRVHEPIVESGIKTPSWEKPRITGAYGYVEISRHYFNGTTFVMDAYAYAYNGTDETLRAQAWFRQTEYTASDGAVIDEKRDTKDLEDVEAGTMYGSYTPDSSIVNFDINRLIGEDEERYFDAHTHLQVTTVEGIFVQDDWEVDTTILTFTAEDNP